MNQPQTFPSIRAHMGDIEYYVTTMTLEAVSKWIKRPEQTRENDKDFKNWLQREINESRLKGIANYLETFDQRFFNAVVVGIFGGEPKWFPVSVTSGEDMDDGELTEQTRLSMGVLQLSGDEDAFPIDGQHRVEAIKEAIELKPKLKGEEIAVIFVAHRTTDEGRERTRRLFTTLNKYAKPVSQGEIVALDEDDAFAIVTRDLMSKKNRLKGFILLAKDAKIPPSNHSCLTTAVALYQMIQKLPLPKGCRDVNTLKIGPASDTAKQIVSIYKQQIEFWKLLTEQIPEIAEILSSNPGDNIAAKFRTDIGGHLMFRPAGQHAFAEAARILVKRGRSFEEAVKKLCKVGMILNEEPWKYVLWSPATKTMLVRYSKLARNLFLHLAGENHENNYDLLGTYRNVVERPDAKLDHLRVEAKK